jgi:hypothetical protein
MSVHWLVRSTALDAEDAAQAADDDDDAVGACDAPDWLVSSVEPRGLWGRSRGEEVEHFSFAGGGQDGVSAAGRFLNMSLKHQGLE